MYVCYVQCFDYILCAVCAGQRVRPTIDELVDPNGRYVKRSIDVMSDPVGYGFVIRGAQPVYIHSVDPSGPAAAAGLQVTHCTTNCCQCYVLVVMTTITDQ